jgi:hypothetical protein
MIVHQLNIVALPYWEVKHCLDEFYAEAMGRMIVLRAQESNEVDDVAVKAYDWKGRHVGYVASNDRATALAILKVKGSKARGEVQKVNAEHACLTIECVADIDKVLPEIYHTKEFEAWEYDGPVMPITEVMDNLEFMADEIRERLTEADEWTEADEGDFTELTERFCETSRYDISGDMCDFRKWLAQQLSARRMDDLAELVGREDGRAGRECKNGGEVTTYWMELLTGTATASFATMMLTQHSIGKVEEQLRAFPQNLYNVWLNDRERFLSRVLYQHIPRKVMWRLMSGIAFVEHAKAKSIENTMSKEERRVAERQLEVVMDMYSCEPEKLSEIRRLYISMGWKEQANKLGEYIKSQQRQSIVIEGNVNDIIESGGQKTVNNNR